MVKTMKKPEMTDEDWMLYMAFIIKKLTNWKYEALGKLAGIRKIEGGEKIIKEIIGKSPCGIDAIDIFISTVKRAKPDMYDPEKTINWHIAEVEKYLFKGEK